MEIQGDDSRLEKAQARAVEIATELGEESQAAALVGAIDYPSLDDLSEG